MAICFLRFVAFGLCAGAAHFGGAAPVVALADVPGSQFNHVPGPCQLGYRLQLGKVGQGFVSALLVPQGNAVDGGQLIPVLLDHWERHGVLPSLVSAADGYSSRNARENLRCTGVAVVIISGSMGRQITLAYDWQRLEY